MRVFSMICLASWGHSPPLSVRDPPEDVREFITRRGQDFVYSGYWKVYTNEAEARALFEQYSVCTHEFCTRLEAGSPLAELVQAV